MLIILNKNKKAFAMKQVAKIKKKKIKVWKERKKKSKKKHFMGDN